MSRLGLKFKDRITGFEGVCVGHCEYLTGCNQSLLQPEGDTVSKRPEAEWFDDQRLIELDAPRLTLDNGKTPGCDKPAPKR